MEIFLDVAIYIASVNLNVYDITSIIYVSVPNLIIGFPNFSGIGSNALTQQINLFFPLLLQCTL